jgi:hypothetical protein
MGGSAVAPAVLLAVCALAIASAPSADAGAGPAPPTSEPASSFAVSPPARDLGLARRSGSAGQAPARINPLDGRLGPGLRGTRGGADSDPLAGSEPAPGRTPSPGLTFEGADNGCACLPPDTTGDVGPNHYIQLVNSTEVSIFNKAGTLVTPSFDLGGLWPPADTCRIGRGDPQVLYDPIADRWNLVQFDDVGNRLCWAVSQTADPTGAYNLFDFTVPQFPDYFKIGVWPNGYYVGSNEANYSAYAFDRTKMLAGDPSASFVRFSSETNFLMPADLDGTMQPTGGGLVYTFKDGSFHGGSDRIELFRLTPDFATPANSTFTLINSFPIASFTYTVCGFFQLNCIKQPGGAPGLDPVSEWPMQRFAYRKFAGHEALVGNFTVRAHAPNATSAGAGIRWFELRNTGSGWTLFQEGTQDPNDGIDRWMGSIAIDRTGNIALGYAASSTGLEPSIRYATRAPSDPAGTLQAEQTLQAGGGHQTISGMDCCRWGDYSAMSVDPGDDCTFWYTQEYYPATSSSTWHTRIGNFVVPGCTTPAPSFFVNPSSINFGNQTVGTNSSFQTVTVTNEGNANLSIGSVGLATGNTGDFGTGSDTCSGATLTPGQTCTVQARFSPTAAGARSTNLRFTDNASGSPHDVALTGTGSTSTSTPPTPSNAFTIGGVKRNTKKGTATLTVQVPGPGEVALSGNGVRPLRPVARRDRDSSPKPVGAPGPVELQVKATGGKKRKLLKAGKVKVRATITYTPTGGSPASQSLSVKLKRKR